MTEDRERLVREFNDRQCAAQGVPRYVTDPVTIARLVPLLLPPARARLDRGPQRKVPAA